MAEIIKPMTSKKRVLTAFAHEIPDRVPIDYDCNPAINKKIAEHFGVDPADRGAVKRALGCDFIGVRTVYKGKPLFAPSADPKIQVDSVYGMHRRYVEHETGGYWDYCDFPMLNAPDEVIANWPVPNPDDFDIDNCLAICKANADMALYLGHPGIGDILNTTGMLMGVEQALVNFVSDDEATLEFTRRRLDSQLGLWERVLDKCGDYIALCWIGEDLGTQRGQIISNDLYERNIKPFHSKFTALAKHYGKPVMIHSCGSSSWAFKDFIDIGIDIVDTLQPEAALMEPAYLKQTYGDKLSFHGCISTAGPLAYGSVQDTIDICKQTLEVMMPGGGYAFSPTHAIQDNSPLENVLAAYETAHTCGVYGK